MTGRAGSMPEGGGGRSGERPAISPEAGFGTGPARGRGLLRISDLDLTAIRGVAVTRVLVAAIVAGWAVLGARGEGPRIAALSLLAGVAWLPWSAVLLRAVVGRPSGRLATGLAVYGGPVGDVLMVFAAQSLAPRASGAFLLADALAVSVAASLWRERHAWMLLALSVALTMLAQAAVPAGDRMTASSLLVFALAVAGLVLVIGRMSQRHRLVDVRSSRLRAKAETIVARVADGIVVTDGSGVVLECNPAGERLIDRVGGSAVGMPCIVALGLREGERLFDCRQGCALLAPGGGSCLEGRPPQDAGAAREVWRALADGRRQPLLASAFAVVDEHGGVEVVHSLRDITRLKEADEAKTLFLATASHELKTPVAVIAGFAQAILQYPAMPPDRRADAVEAIHRRALELSSIVDRLLLSSKIEGGRVRVDVHPLDVRPVLAERASPVQDATGRSVLVQVPAEPLVAQADAQAVRTVVDHLLDNAIKYSDGGPVILGARRDDGAKVSIWVSDIGIGMDDEQAARCFEKFWQAESTDVRRFGGTGIGLYIVQSLVDAMGGVITVETAAGRGSTFTVSLPAGAPAGVAQPAAPAAAAVTDIMRHIGALSSEHRSVLR